MAHHTSSRKLTATRASVKKMGKYKQGTRKMRLAGARRGRSEVCEFPARGFSLPTLL